MSLGTAAIELEVPFPTIEPSNIDRVFVAVAGGCIIRVDSEGNYFTRINGQAFSARMDGGEGLVDGIFHFNLDNPLG